ncbi:MAG: fused MFS/spermidine synthase [Burkholderiales bacterium]|nr:fused MFS/spermidine synthase [Burkholderiales bacterium]
MTTIAQAAPPGVRGAVLLPWLYGAALFAAALLLFWIQPLYVRMVLPRFGGAPAVWTTAAMFFQAALLAGYLYAHALSRALPLRRQALAHLVLLGSVLPLLPPAIDAGAAHSGGPVTALLALLAAGIGLPFFALAATAPLLQRWFSHTRHAGAPDPYFLYVASNAGSLTALAAYPFVIEPARGIARQNRVWAGAYAALALLIAACAAAAWRYREADAGAAAVAAAAAPAWRERLYWVALAFAPSSLMLGVTQHISSEIAAVPLMWLVPLTLYVLTFVNAFARRPPVALGWAVRAQPILVIVLALVWMLNIYIPIFLLHLVSFFVTALMCHGELARRRPPAARLTEFYLLMAAGGALGGAFNALAAPLLFDTIAEYPLVIAAACMLRPAAAAARAFRWADIVLPAVLGAGYAALVHFGVHPLAHGKLAIVLYVEALGVALYLMHGRPLRFGLAVAVTLLASGPLHSAEDVLARYRSFFGVHTVVRDESGRFRVLLNGITVHGAQHLEHALRHEPTTFYHRDGPLGQLFSALGAGGRLRRIALVGLGTGSAVCHRAPEREWTVIEIDPTVVAIARDSGWFDFLAACAPRARIVTGDGRLALAGERDAAFDLVILDTFSSDAIPVHMVTREAVELYFRKLAPRGVLMFHISNQYLDLAPVLAAIARSLGLAAMAPGPRFTLPFDGRFSQMESRWIALARAPVDLAALAADEGWVAAEPAAPGRPWTDDYSNILQALK